MKSSSPKVAIVTGASSGIGAITAQLLARSGYRVFGTSRKASANAAGQSGVEMLALDVTVQASVDALVSQVLAAAGRIDVLVNNAGFGISSAAAEESSMQQAAQIFDTNVLGLIRMSKAVLPQMRRQGSGRIINISSVLGLLPTPFGALYSASKHAVEGYSESLDHELRTDGIRISLVEPAVTKTAFFQNSVPPDAPHARFDIRRAKVNQALQRAEAGGDDPQVVATTVLRVLDDPAPKVRYTAGKAAGRLSLLRRFAPAGVFDGALRKGFGMTP